MAAWLVIAASAVGYADEQLQNWIPDALTMPKDAKVVRDRTIGSSVRLFSITTGTDVDSLFVDWQESLSSDGYAVKAGEDELSGQSIEFSGPGILNAKIIADPATSEGHRVINFDATLN